MHKENGNILQSITHDKLSKPLFLIIDRLPRYGSIKD